MAVEYGTIGIRPRGEWDPDTKYDLLNLVVHDGSSYVAHKKPPKGNLPTDTDYWQVSAQGTGKATSDSVGTVKPDGTTTEVSTDGALSVKQATQTTAGIVKGSDGIKVRDDGSIDVNTQFTQATELANIIAGEAIAEVLGKLSKSIATTMNLDQNALLKNMLTNIDVNDSNKVPTSAFVHTLVEKIETVNSNLDGKADKIVYPSMPSDADSAFGFASRYPNAIAPYSGLNWTDMPTAEAGWYGRVETRGYFDDSYGGNILFYSNFGMLIASRGFKNSGWSSDWIRYATNSDLDNKLTNDSPDHFTSVGFDTTKSVLKANIDGTVYPIPINVFGDNRFIKGIGIYYDTTKSKNVLQVNWYADGTDHTDYIDFS